MSTRIFWLLRVITPFIFSITFLLIFFNASQSWASNFARDELVIETASPKGQALPFRDVYIVRVYYQTQEILNQIAARTEPWEVNKEQGYAIVEVDALLYNWLIDMGLKVEIDQRLNQQYHTQRVFSSDQVSGIPDYACYKTVEETYAFAESLAITYPSLTEWIDIGDSWQKTQSNAQGYDLYVLKITNKNTTFSKPNLFVMSGLHAREYAPPELNTYFVKYLLENYNVDPDVTWLLDYHAIHLLLHANPDGRKFAESRYYWRKNTNENYCSPTSYYRGADLNRNFAFHWNDCDGSNCSSSNECYDTFRGVSPASEPETLAIQNYLISIFLDQRGELDIDSAPITSTGVFIDLHSYGNQVLWPWGFTEDPAPNNDGLQTLGRKFSYFNLYEPGQASNILYPTDGDSDGFAYGALGVPGYTFEVGTAFFQDCSYFQENIISENLPALVYAAKIARYPYLLPSGPDVVHLSVTPILANTDSEIVLQANINDKRYYGNNEPTQNISAAEFYIDTPPWVTTTIPISYTMNVEDGIFDEKIETVTATIDTTGLSQGRHVIFVRGQDALGNWGPVSAEFIYLYNQLYYFPMVTAP